MITASDVERVCDDLLTLYSVAGRRRRWVSPKVQECRAWRAWLRTLYEAHGIDPGALLSVTRSTPGASGGRHSSGGFIDSDRGLIVVFPWTSRMRCHRLSRATLAAIDHAFPHPYRKPFCWPATQAEFAKHRKRLNRAAGVDLCIGDIQSAGRFLQQSNGGDTPPDIFEDIEP